MTGAPRPAAAADVPAAWVAVFGEGAPSSTATAVDLPRIDGRARRLWLICSGESDTPDVARSETCAVVFAGRRHVSEQPVAAHSLGVRDDEDASAVLRAYLHEGEAALRRLRGRFVLLVWDCERDLLLAARDPLGYYPLFYASVHGVLFFSMSADALFRRPEVSSEVDPVAAASWVAGRWVHGTFFRDISRLPPGHWLLADDAGVRTERYWRPTIPTRIASAPWDAVQEEFDLLMSRAVDRCLDLGPAAVFLSGGTDSVTIAAAATANSRERDLPDPVALCVEFPGRAVDESAVQGTVATMLGIPRVALPFEDELEPERTLVETLEAASWLPLPPSPWFSTFCDLARTAAACGCKTTIGGEGSEWFTHDETAFAADLLRSIDLEGLYNLYVAERQYSGTSRRRIVRGLLWDWGARVLLRDLVARSLVAVGGEARLSELLVQRQLRTIPFWVAPDPGVRRRLAERWASVSPRPQRGSFQRKQRLSLLDLPDNAVIMDLYYARSQHLGIEWQDGFHDVDLIEFLLSIPFELLVAGARAKSLAQASIGRRLPAFDLRLLRKVYLGQAYEALLADRVRRAVEILGGFPVLAGLGAVDPQPVLRFAAGEWPNPALKYYHLWYAVAMEAWLQARV